MHPGARHAGEKYPFDPSHISLNSPVASDGTAVNKRTQVDGPAWRRRRRLGLVSSVFVVKHSHSVGESNAFVVAMPWELSQLRALWAYQGRWRDRGSEPRRSLDEDKAAGLPVQGPCLPRPAAW